MMQITGYKKKHVWGNSTVYLMDCMEALPQYAAGYFDLAVVDPPYGIEINMNMGRKRRQPKRHLEKDWDNSIPQDIYFDELFSVSENKIIWGGNYFPLPLTKSWIFWDKNVPDGVSFADGELAWTSFDKTLVKAKIDYSGFKGMDDGGKIHPTQKPIALYSWIYANYLPGGGRVIDTHLGSGSNRIAADKAGNIDFVGIELDEDYFAAAVKRFEQYAAQLKLF